MESEQSAVAPEYRYVVETLGRYWRKNDAAILDLPMPGISGHDRRHEIPPQGKHICLPYWAREVAVQGKLFVPEYAVFSGDGPGWQRTDWLEAAFWYVSGAAETEWEKHQGPIHSYACRLKGWDSRFWERAWANRIALFLRRWAARKAKVSEHDYFGPLPPTEVIVTHDVDAVNKTFAIRAKQTGFHTFNALRNLTALRFQNTVNRLKSAFVFAVSTANYWRFDQIRKLEESLGIRSHFNFYAGESANGSLKKWLFDPPYCVMQPRIRETMRQLHRGGWTIGLHPSFDSWRDAGQISRERSMLEDVLGHSITVCRQHWLRFSWRHTWRAQEKAGLKLDTTLGFNDRPGFRNGCALRFRPWSPEGEIQKIEALPLVFMDSHFYDYQETTDEDRDVHLRYWLKEVEAVHGTATVLWHQRVLSKDYGWDVGYRKLLRLLVHNETVSKAH